MINLENELLTLTLSLYSNPSIPRKIVQYFVDQIIHFTNTIYATYLREQMQLKFKNCDTQLFTNIQDILDSSKIIFRKFQTEYQRFSLYQEKDLLAMPKDSCIGVRIPKNHLVEKEPFAIENVYAQYIPLKTTLKVFLELPGMFDLMLNYIKELETETNIMSNFIQGRLWKEEKKNFWR